MKRIIFQMTKALLLAALLGCGPAAFAADTNGWVFLDNGQLRLGVKTNSGACIGHLSPSSSPRNLLNHHDHGRFIQQSYYGDPDGSLWGDKPWRWNPVQGGDYRGHPARLLAFQATATNLYAKTLPKHWAGGADMDEVRMEEWISLEGRVAHVHYWMTYSGQKNHPSVHQELPAVFMDYDLPHLVFYHGSAPWTRAALTRKIPGWPNQKEEMTENWAAYVDNQGRGAGVFVPGTSEMTCYRYAGRGGADGSGCSYFAPVRSFAITTGTSFEYDVYLTIGTETEMREAFYQLHEKSAHLQAKQP